MKRQIPLVVLVTIAALSAPIAHADSFLKYSSPSSSSTSFDGTTFTGIAIALDLSNLDGAGPAGTPEFNAADVAGSPGEIELARLASDAQDPGVTFTSDPSGPTTDQSLLQGIDLPSTDLSVSSGTILSSFNASSLGTAIVPEPSSLILLGIGMLGLTLVAFRKPKHSGITSHS
jgi:hypothetical protein